MQGEHVSNFILGDSEEPLNFLSFTEEMVNSRVMSFSRRGREVIEVDSNKIANWVFYAIDFLGMLAGSLIARSTILGNKKYCDNCKRYMKQKKLLSFSAIDDERLTRFTEIAYADSSDIVALIQNESTSIGKDYYEVHFHSCDTCSSGVIELKYMEVGSNKKISHKEEKSIDIPVGSNVTHVIKQLR